MKCIYRYIGITNCLGCKIKVKTVENKVFGGF